MRRAAVRLRRLPFVIRTDVRGYYANIDPVKLVERLARYVPDAEILRLVAAVTARTSERGGLFRDSGGLPLGCPLSPLLGAFFLKELDERLEATGLFFVRYMDDILVLAPTRWKLQRAVKVVNETLAELGLAKHPDKTFIGRVERGFDFLGYRLSPKGLTVAKQTLERFVTRAARLQEQERSGRAAPGALGAYVRRWVTAGVVPFRDARGAVPVEARSRGGSGASLRTAGPPRASGRPPASTDEPHEDQTQPD
ncbi:MAG: reverse transcriptase domain-containing protein [Planctomycetota bacterium]